MFRARSLLVVVVVSSALGCPALTPVAAPPAPPATAPKEEPVVWTLSKTGLGFRLSDADARDDRRPAPTRAARLSDADVKRVLERLPPMKEDPSDAKDFALRDRSKPAPRAGATTVSAFPPPDAGGPPPTPSAPPSAPLTVTRKQPVGTVDLAPALTVSFSQPMVAITSHDELARTPPPVVLTPTPPGKWRWVGAQTVVFDPDKRFPMATEYTVEVPAGTRAAGGQTIAHAEKWTFTTPPPTLKTAVPSHGPQRLDPVMYAEFDQAIDAGTVIETLRLEAGGKPLPVRLATEDEIASDAAVRLLSGKAQAGRWLAFKAKDKLPSATSFVIRFPDGTPSAEGPRRTTREQHATFYTYHPMSLARTSCGWGECAPDEPWTLAFTNPIDTRRFDPAWVKISPEPESYRVDATGNAITIRPRSKGKAKYTVSVDGAIGDTFGQTMGKVATGEITVAPAEPFLFAEERDMSVLDPASGPVLPVFSVNRPALDVHLYAVGPDDWAAYQRWRRDWDYDDKPSDPPGRLVVSRKVAPSKIADQLVTTPIDLTAALTDGVGQVLVVVEPPGKRPKGRWDRQWVRTWVQVTNLGLQVVTDSESLTAWCTDLATGAPLGGVDVFLGRGAAAGTTDATGLARVDLLPVGTPYLAARRGKDLALLPDASGSARYTPSDEARWLVFDDRHTYKPGEEVRIKGWIRKLGMAKGGDVAAVPDVAGTRVAYVANDARGVEIAKGSGTIDASGGFDLSLKLPATPNLGQAAVHLTAEGLHVNGPSHTHQFDVQEFRRPEFEVNARPGEGPFFVGGHTNVTVTASYFAGGGLPNAEVGWTVFRSDARFVPPNRADYAFGKAEDWWWRSRGTKRGAKASGAPETFPGRTGPSGEHRVRVDFDALDPAYPMGLRFEGTVTDVNRQAWSGATQLLVHPAEVYVGVRQARTFVKAGEPFAVDVLVADLDGKAIAGRPVKVRSARIDWTYEAGEAVEVESDLSTCDLTSGAEATPCALATREGGRYRLTAVVTDRFDRKSQTETHFWVLGDRARGDDTLDRGKIELIPSKASYAPGEVAELLVVAPFAPAEGLLTIRRQGLVLTSRFQLTSTTQPVTVRVDPAWLPNATAHVAIVGAVPRDNARGVADPSLPRRPAFAQGSTTIKIPPRERSLAVTARARDAKLDPGGSTTVDVDVRDASGAPVAGSTAAVVVVDEAILALSGYATPDPLAVFYADRSADTREAELRERVLVARPEDKRLRAKASKSKDSFNGHGAGAGSGRGFGAREKKADAMPAPAARAMASASPIVNELTELDQATLGSRDDKPREPGKPIALRQDFGPLALFAPTVTTDAAGHASVAVKLPDSLTRYRVMAVAVAGEKQFGSGEGSVTARLPLMVRPSAPRFLNFGDRFDLPIVLQNQTDAPIEVDLAARAVNADLVEGAGRRVSVPANDRVEVRLPAATVRAGTARFQIGAASGAYADAAQVELPVWTPATTEAFATYGTVDEGAVAQPVKMPSGVVTQFGGLEITTSSTALSSLTDAVLYLLRYPFECNEQLSSRVLAISALRDVLTAFNGKDMPSKEALAESMKRDIEKLRSRQHWSGGWDFWRSDREPWPYLSVHVTHALERARTKGYAVPKQTLDGALRYLRSIESHIPGWYSPESRHAIIAYALFVRKRLDDADPARAKRLVAEAGGVDKLGLEPVGWLWPTLLDDPSATAELAEVRKHVANRVSETAGAAHFTTSYADGSYVLLHSDRRADGILLDALIGDQQKSDLIPKLVSGLLGHRKAGRWLSTQENAFVLLALDRYFATYEKATPDFVARAWLGDRYAGEHTFKGRSADRHQIDVPMATMAEVGSADLVLSKTGPGRLYYRVGMSYAPSDLRPPPADHGFTVTRQYEPVDDPADVKRDADGTWRVKAGTKVRIRVTMVVPSRRYHVALVDPLPAGLEAMNPALAVTGTVPADPSAPPSGGSPWWWRSTWYEHQNLRDERVEAFASLVWDGVYDYTYVARATTPGTFVVPPPKAEEMYAPETFGRGSGDRLVVE